MPTPDEIRAMAERLETTPNRPTRSIPLGNGTSTTGFGLGTFSQDDADRKDAAALLRALLAEREDDEKTRELRKRGIADLAAARRAISGIIAEREWRDMGSAPLS